MAEPVNPARVQDTAVQPNAEQSTSCDGNLGAQLGVLELGDAVRLSFGQTELLISDRSAPAKSNRVCGFGSAPASSPKSVPFYNILHAEISADQRRLVIDYAKPTSAANLEVAHLKYAIPPTADPSATGPVATWTAQLLDHAYPPLVTRRKRAWVLVNPHAGRGGASRIWEHKVRPIFEAARMPLTVVRTTHSGQAVDLARELDVDAFDVAVACSGDGLPHEVFNGLARRTDARRVLARLAVCQVPCGSGNAMSCNLTGSAQAGPAALAIVKGVPTVLDLMSVTQAAGANGERVERTLSFLSQAYGIMADLDIATEPLRWMGEHRFVIGFLKLVLQRRTYPCDIAVKVEIDNRDAIREHYRAHALGEAQAQQRGGNDGRSEAASSSAASGDDGQGLPPLRYGTAADKLPEGWELIPHDKLGYFYCGNMGYMAADINFFPAALPGDGMMDLFTMDGDISPWLAIKMQGRVEDGSFFDHPLVHYRKISAFRLVPREDRPDGLVSIDGERIPYRTFQVEIHPGLGLTLSKTGGYEVPGPNGWKEGSGGAAAAAS